MSTCYIVFIDRRINPATRHSETTYGSLHRLDLDARASQVLGRAARAPNRQDPSFMAFVQFTQPDDQPIVINTDRIVTATPLPDGQGTRINLNNGGYQDVKQLIADVLRQLNISA